MEKCQICGRNAIARIGEVWLCEKKECHEKFFSVEEILRKAGITRADKVLGSPLPTAVLDQIARQQERIAELEAALNDVITIADNGRLPDGDTVNVPTRLWAEELKLHLKKGR